jgi:hypothetical protein
MQAIFREWFRTLGFIFLAIATLVVVSLLFGFVSIKEIVKNAVELLTMFVFVAGFLLICGGIVALFRRVIGLRRRPMSPYMRKK